MPQIAPIVETVKKKRQANSYVTTVTAEKRHPPKAQNNKTMDVPKAKSLHQFE
jgi:hypothetical protein